MKTVTKNKCDLHCKVVVRRLVAITLLVTAWLIGRPSGAAESRAFANYVRFIPTGPTSLDVLYEEGPFIADSGIPTLADLPLLGWNSNAVATISSAGDPPTLDETTLIATLPILDTLTSIAHDNMGNELGRIELLGVGNQKLNLNAENAIVDDAAGTIAVQFGGSLLGGEPSAHFSLINATGIYSSDVRVSEEVLVGYAGGVFLLPLDNDPATSLQDNILNAFSSGQLAGIDVVGVWTGQYVTVPERSASLLFASGVILIVGWQRRRYRRPNRL